MNDTENPGQPNPQDENGQVIEGLETTPVGWPLAVKIWWSFAWRSSLFGMLAGMVLGMIGGVLLALTGLAGPDNSNAGMIGTILGYLASIPISIWVMKTIFNKEFPEYRLVVVPKQSQHSVEV